MSRIIAYLVSAALLLSAALFLGWFHIARQLRDEILNNNVEGKICALQGRFGSSGIIIAGDSRANYQLNPLLFEKETGIATVNISINNSDPITLLNAIEKYPELLAKSKLLIVSVGIYQVNDGAIDYGYLSLASFVNLGVLDHLRIYRKRPGELIRMYREAFRIFRMRQWKNMRFGCGDYWTAGFDLYATKGFEGHTWVRDRNVERDPMVANSWFKDLRVRGVRWRQFRDAIRKLDRLGLPVVIFQSPYGATWMRDPICAKAIAAEKEFSGMLRGLANGSENIRFLDYFNQGQSYLPDSLFLDACHLNADGAEAFSRMFLRDLVQKGWLSVK